MIAKSIKIDKRGIGDCVLAKGHESYGLYFEKNSEITKLTNAIYKAFKSNFSIKPNVRLTGRNCRKVMGTCNPITGKIRLHNNGASVGVLIHELAHCWKVSTNHNRYFKMAQTSMLQWFSKNRADFVSGDVKVEKTKPFEDDMEFTFYRRGGNKIDVSNLFTKNAPNPNNIKVGDRVWWIQKKFGRVEGTVKRMNVKTATIDNHNAPTSGYFRCSPSLLKRVDITPKVPESNVSTSDSVKEGFSVKTIQEELKEKYGLNRYQIHTLMDKLSKYAVKNTISMSGIKKCLWVNGIKNTEENRQIAIDYIKETLKLGIR